MSSFTNTATLHSIAPFVPVKTRSWEDAMRDYLEMITYCRPSGSKGERKFVNRFLRPLGMDTDAAGNNIVSVGKSNVLWSSHTDTVHGKSGRQEVSIKGDTIKLRHGSASSCLGADCTTGVWIMREMILSKVPGLYVFHAAEEVGGVGSDFIRRQTPTLLKSIDAAIAFDRKGTDSIITHQGGERCCSKAFSASLCGALGGGFLDDDGGSFTDTANYTDLVGECTNISVGYDAQHTRSESQDWKCMKALRERMLAFKFDALEFERQPGEQDPDDHRFRHGVGFLGHSTWNDSHEWEDDERYTFIGSRHRGSSSTMDQIVRGNPAAISDFLEHHGISTEEIEDWIYASQGFVTWR